MTKRMPRPALTEWRYLQDKARAMQLVHLNTLAHDQERNRVLTFRAGPLLLDISKQKLDQSVLAGLIGLAETVGLPQAIQSLAGGAALNNTEKRPALHSALRLPKSASLKIDGQDIVSAVHDSLERMRTIVKRVHSRQWRGFSGRAITDVVNIGVGGSDLGPFMACQALNEFVPEEAARLHIHFVSSIDGTQVADLLGVAASSAKD